VTVKSPGFATRQFAATLRPGETYLVPPIILAVAPALTELGVRDNPLTLVQAADMQIGEQEKQRVLGFSPNFYVSYDRDALPVAGGQLPAVEERSACLYCLSKLEGACAAPLLIPTTHEDGLLLEALSAPSRRSARDVQVCARNSLRRFTSLRCCMWESSVSTEVQSPIQSERRSAFGV
jgi:hypothetical protein